MSRRATGRVAGSDCSPSANGGRFRPARSYARPRSTSPVVAPYDFATAAHLERELGVSHVLAQVLVRRGLGDPTRRGVPRGRRAPPARRVRRAAWRRPGDLGHVARGARITVHGDYDVDGVCATACSCARCARSARASTGTCPAASTTATASPRATVERLAARGTRLLVTVDCAITAVEEVAAARAAGLDVVVTDHHAPRADGALPDAPIVHPAVGGYPCPTCARPASRTSWPAALLEAAGEDPARADEDLDLVALATVADVVPLTGENRRLVRAGLAALAAHRASPGLRALMDVARVDPSGVDAARDRLPAGPRINAAGRLHRADAGLELLLTDDAAAPARSPRARRGERRAPRRRDAHPVRGRGAGRRARRARRPTSSPAEGWHPGVIGIVAAAIAERHHRPAVLIALDGDEGTGSGRSIPAFDLLAGLHAARRHLARYGGHRAAAGLTIARDERRRVPRGVHGPRRRRPGARGPRARASASTPSCPATRCLDLAEELQRLAPFGMGNPGRRCSCRRALLDDPRAMGEGRHVAFTLSAGGARAARCRFGARRALPAEARTPVDAAVRARGNRWNGAVEPRLVLRHARTARPEAHRGAGGARHLRRRAMRGARQSVDAGARDRPRDARAPPEGGVVSGRRGRGGARRRDARARVAGSLGGILATSPERQPSASRARAAPRRRCASASAASRSLAGPRWSDDPA